PAERRWGGRSDVRTHRRPLRESQPGGGALVFRAAGWAVCGHAPPGRPHHHGGRRTGGDRGSARPLVSTHDHPDPASARRRALTSADRASAQWPRKSASMSVVKKHFKASATLLTIGSPRMLKEVLSRHGTPVRRSNSSISR